MRPGVLLQNQILAGQSNIWAEHCYIFPALAATNSEILQKQWGETQFFLLASVWMNKWQHSEKKQFSGDCFHVFHTALILGANCSAHIQLHRSKSGFRFLTLKLVFPPSKFEMRSFHLLWSALKHMKPRYFMLNLNVLDQQHVNRQD